MFTKWTLFCIKHYLLLRFHAKSNIHTYHRRERIGIFFNNNLDRVVLCFVVIFVFQIKKLYPSLQYSRYDFILTHTCIFTYKTLQTCIYIMKELECVYFLLNKVIWPPPSLSSAFFLHLYHTTSTHSLAIFLDFEH